MPKRPLDILVVLVLALCLWPAAVRAEETDDDMGILQMYYDENDLRVTVTRNEVPLSSVAETVTIITADDIRAMNAHTISEALAHVPGLQFEMRGGPGSTNTVYVRGGLFQHVRVLLDGVTINNFASSTPDLDALPAHIVERIEVMRGPASSSWGSALGGVVNIVTRSIPANRKISGEVYASGGESGFHDTNLQLAGTLGSFSYYTYGGHLGESGLSTGSSVDTPAGYGKFRWQSGSKASMSGSILYSAPDRSSGWDMAINSQSPTVNAAITGTYSILKGLEIEILGRAAFEKFTQTAIYRLFDPTPSVSRNNSHELGVSTLVRWQGEHQSVVGGFEYSEGDYAGTDFPRKGLAKSGVFLADTLTFGPVAITPGVRYDWTKGISDRHNFSPSIGIAWRLTDGTIFRTSAAKGFNQPEVLDTKEARIWSVQAGVETTEIPFLWLRGTFFYNEVRNQPVIGWQYDDIRRTGYEIEVRTVPVWDVSLSGGAMFMDTESMKTGKASKGEPTTSFNVDLRYDDGSLRASLLGRYVDWNAVKTYGPFNFNPDYEDFIWDFHVQKKLTVSPAWQPEIFFSLHNIFDGNQYLIQYWKNPGRWAEGGVRFSF